MSVDDIVDDTEQLMKVFHLSSQGQCQKSCVDCTQMYSSRPQSWSGDRNLQSWSCGLGVEASLSTVFKTNQ